jgi:hypothetical protein
MQCRVAHQATIEKAHAWGEPGLSWTPGADPNPFEVRTQAEAASSQYQTAGRPSG